MIRRRAFSVILACLTLASVPAARADNEAEAISAVIEKAYVGGIWMEGDEEAARSGFDPAFVMQVSREEGLLSVSLDAWLERLGLDGGPPQEGITVPIEVLDRTGDAAVAKVVIDKAGGPLYTDYMSLYKRGGEWKIVAETFDTQ